jgi:DNA-binding transcriptional LysR family regulator
MDWRDLQTFLAIAEAGSTHGAARALGLDQSTVSRRLAAFEASLGVRLFERAPSGLALTPAGEAARETGRQVEDDINGFERRMASADQALSGEVRLTLPPFLLEGVLTPVLMDFHARYPEVSLDIDVSINEANLTKREADIAVRGSNTPPEHLIGRRICAYHIALYARAGQAEPAPPWVGWGEPGELPAWAKAHGFEPPETVWRSDAYGAQMALARAGLGAALLPCFIADKDPELARVPPGETWPSREIWVLTHKDLLAAPRVRILFNHLADALAAQRARFEGLSAS